MESLKKYLKKTLIPQIIARLQKFIDEKKKNMYIPISLESLTPTCDSDDDNIYKSALKNALDNSTNYNIGITGAYGSGKSSILESFIKNHESDYRFLKISLASFNENNLTEIENKRNTISPIEDGGNQTKNGNTNIPKNENEKPLPDDDTLHEVNQLIELSILQQLLYHVKIREIPNSRFNRIKRHNPPLILLYAFLFFTWLLSIIFISELGFIKETTLWKCLDWGKSSRNISTIAFSYFSIGSIYLLFQIIRFINISKLTKLNIKDGEIEVNRTDDRSILNRYLDEVFYFFEMTKHNVVIIEDLDRLKNSMIFTKLRELNVVLNNSDQIKKSVGRIVFIYALRDDLFKDKSRTKFFDVIIPIIPIINTTNSGSMFLKLLRKADLNHNLSTEFINDISLFIDDMRLLKNIYNEYLIYREKIKKVPDQNNLLAMIVYKNIFPTEFIKLHDCSSIIYKVLKSEKNALTKNAINTIDQKIETIKKQIEDAKGIVFNNEKELNAIYINAFWSTLDNPVYIVATDGSEISYSGLSDINVFKKLRNNEISSYYRHQYGITPITPKFQDIENKINADKSYEKKITDLKNRNNIVLLKLGNELDTLNIERRDITSWSLKKIAEKENITNEFSELNEPKHRLTLYLLRKGYIDENYDLYISFFHDGDLTSDDHKFVMSVKCSEAIDCRFKLTNTKEIISKLYLPEFEQKEILNIDLLDYLITNRTNFNPQFNTLIDQLTNESKQSIEFIDIYIDEGKGSGYFMEQLCHKWPNIWDFIELFSNYSTQRKEKYLAQIIKYAKLEDLDKINEAKRFSDYIKEQQYFLSLIPDDDIEKAKSVISNLNIIFTQLEPTFSESKLFDFIYENEYYELNQKMIEFIIKGKGIKFENLTELLERRNYSTIRTSECKHLLKYLLENINKYVEHIFLKLENNNEEEEESILDLLTNEDIYSDLKKKIIIKNNTKISDISKIKNKDLYPIIAEHSKMIPTWENIYTYLEIEIEAESTKTKSLKIIDEALTTFLNQRLNYDELSKKKIGEVRGKEKPLIETLCNRIVFCQGLTINSFKSLHNSIPFTFPSLSQKNISDEKIDYMINSGFLSFTSDNFKFLRKHYPLKHISLIELNPSDFIISLDKFNINGNDVLLILESIKFTENQKISVIKSINTTILYAEKYACNAIFEFLVNKSYIDLPIKLIETLFKFGTNDSYKIAFFNLLLKTQKIDFTLITLLLLAMGHPFSRLTKKGIKQKISSRKENKTFMEHLKRLDYNIDSTMVSGGYINVKTKS